MTTVLLDRTAPPAVHFPATARYEAPTRFDVHEVAAFQAWVAEARAAGADRLVVECARIAFLDIAAVEAIDAAAGDVAGPGGLILTDLSPAATLTFELLAAAAGDTAEVAA